MLSQRGDDKTLLNQTGIFVNFILTPSHFYPEEIPQVTEMAMN